MLLFGSTRVEAGTWSFAAAVSGRSTRRPSPTRDGLPVSRWGILHGLLQFDEIPMLDDVGRNALKRAEQRGDDYALISRPSLYGAAADSTGGSATRGGVPATWQARDTLLEKQLLNVPTADNRRGDRKRKGAHR